jgi:hypothetical protein
MTQDPRETMTPDAELGALLRTAEGEPPLDQVDWEGLRSSIVGRAELSLARRRTRSAPLGRWTRRLVPVAAAASVVLAVWVGFPGADPITPLSATEAAVRAEEVFQADVSEEEFRHLCSGRAKADALLLVAVEGAGGID